MDKRTQVEHFALAYMEEDAGHAQQVARLALRLFDELTMLHQLPLDCRELLEYAGLLHDIGWVNGWKEHHKNSYNMIMADERLPFTAAERRMVACVARYHRKALPSASHSAYAALDADEQAVASRLAALLRIADGLDRTHADAIQDLTCAVSDTRVLIHCERIHPADEELAEAQKKADLFTRVFGHEVVFL